ncbi:hypothetical protein ACHAQK_005878 [Fusarium lateritium]
MQSTKELPPQAASQQEKILLEVRGIIEAQHRRDLYFGSVTMPFATCTMPLGSCGDMSHNSIYKMSPFDMEDCANKTVPLYIILKDAHAETGHTFSFSFLTLALHNWLYHKWFRPFRSDIDNNEFVAKVFLPKHLPKTDSPVSLAEDINRLNKETCNQVLRLQEQCRGKEPHPLYAPGHPRDQRHFILQPLFKAITIILQAKDYTVFVKDIGKIPVLLSLTGEEHGLSRSLSFESIRHQVDKFVSKTVVQIPLETAIDFVLAQQEHENAVFGPQPDPVESTKDLGDRSGYLDDITTTMRNRGWGDEPFKGPNSTWVDVEKYPEWVGEGAWEDKNIYAKVEKRDRWTELRRVAGVGDDGSAFRRNKRRDSL